MSRNSPRRPLCFFLFLVLFFMGPAAAFAINTSIDFIEREPGAGIDVFITQDGGYSYQIPNTHPDKATWTFALLGDVIGAQRAYYQDVLEPGSGVISDRLYWEHYDQLTPDYNHWYLIVTFCSGPDVSCYSPGAGAETDPPAPTDATGSLQEAGLEFYMGKWLWDNPTPGANPQVTDFVTRFRADVDGVPVPEPSITLLIGSGLIGLMGFRRKFGKK